jgi:cytidyltransferase-like protein
MGTTTEVWVYVDVVCDLFHAGHASFFRRARALGDRLVVGVVADEDVATYKARPICTFEERVAVVRACRYVDAVLPQPSPLFPTPDFLDEIGASFACHGDDMPAAEIDYFYGRLKPSGRIRLVPYTAGVSTRVIIDRVRERLCDEAEPVGRRTAEHWAGTEASTDQQAT